MISKGVVSLMWWNGVVGGWLNEESVGCVGVVAYLIWGSFASHMGCVYEDICLAHKVFGELPQWSYKELMWHGCGEVWVTTHSHTLQALTNRCFIVWQVQWVLPGRDETPSSPLLDREAPHELGAKPVYLSSIALGLYPEQRRIGTTRKQLRSYNMRCTLIAWLCRWNAPICLMS